MTSPNPEPTPTPPLLPPASPYPDDWTFGPDGSVTLPNYPPYVPESQFDTSQGMPRSTLDGIHGTEDDIAYWSPSQPGELPPSWTSDFKEIAPGVWKKLGPEDYVPGQTHPASAQGSGDGALKVETGELRRAASEHGQRQQRWQDVAANPPNDPDALATSWGVIAHPATESLRASNATRTATANAIATEHSTLAAKLQAAADRYDGTDESGARGVTSTSL